MAGVVVNSREFNAGLDVSVDRFHKAFRRRIQRLMKVAMGDLVRLTPVNTGRAVMNYVATAGAPYAGGVKQAGPPVEATNKLPMGAEQLRPSAEAVSLATLNTVDYSDPYQEFYITNKAPHIGGLEAGELPYKPYVPRNPAGMFRVTLNELSIMLQSWKL